VLEVRKSIDIRTRFSYSRDAVEPPLKETRLGSAATGPRR
jgi:hypothetical protein